MSGLAWQQICERSGGRGCTGAAIRDCYRAGDVRGIAGDIAGNCSAGNCGGSGDGGGAAAEQIAGERGRASAAVCDRHGAK